MDSLSSFRNLNVGKDDPPGELLGKALGWISLGLGAAELIAPGKLSAVIGLEPETRRSVTLRATGARDVAAGLGILMRPRKPGPLWARVAGDVLDLALLAWASRGNRASTGRLIATAIATAGVTAVDLYAAHQASQAQAEASRPMMASVTINKPPAELYAFWRKLEQLPLFMDYLEQVEVIDDLHSKWTAKLPIAGTVSWDAMIVDDQPGERLAWKTEAGKIAHRGQVTFARTPGHGNGCEVRVELELGVPGVPASAALAKLLTSSQIKGDLRRLKQVLETGEVLFSDASSHRAPHAAQPSLAGTERARKLADDSQRAVEDEVPS